MIIIPFEKGAECIISWEERDGEKLFQKMKIMMMKVWIVIQFQSNETKLVKTRDNLHHHDHGDGWIGINDFISFYNFPLPVSHNFLLLQHSHDPFFMIWTEWKRSFRLNLYLSHDKYHDKKFPPWTSLGKINIVTFIYKLLNEKHLFIIMIRYLQGLVDQDDGKDDKSLFIAEFIMLRGLSFHDENL